MRRKHIFFPYLLTEEIIFLPVRNCVRMEKINKNKELKHERKMCFLGDWWRLTKSSDLLTMVWHPGKWPKWNRTLQLMVFSCCYQSVLSMGHLQRGWTKSVWPSPYQWHDSDKTVSTGKVSLIQYYISHGYFNCHLSLLCR